MDKHLLLHRIFKILHYHHYYENEYGLKEHNKKQFKLKKDYNYTFIDPELVHLGFDALRDRYTLCGVLIKESPHFELIKKINNGEDISLCEYIIREENGYLDGRYELKPRNHVEAFNKSKDSILNGDYKPALVYKIDSNYYAFDGKHRLALCCLLRIKCKCYIIDCLELRQDHHTQQLYKKLGGNNSYVKNTDLLKKIMES